MAVKCFAWFPPTEYVVSDKIWWLTAYLINMNLANLFMSNSVEHNPWIFCESTSSRTLLTRCWKRTSIPALLLLRPPLFRIIVIFSFHPCGLDDSRARCYYSINLYFLYWALSIQIGGWTAEGRLRSMDFWGLGRSTYRIMCYMLWADGRQSGV